MFYEKFHCFYTELGANRMKKIYQIIALLVLIGCSTSNREKLESNSTITTVFNKSEIRDLTKILEFFNEQICAAQNVDKNNLLDCFQSFFMRLAEADQTGSIEIRIPYEEQQNMYKQISDSTFNQIWLFEKIWNRHSTDTLKHINYKYDGKYVEFLSALSKEDEVIRNYYENFKALRGISPSMVAELVKNYDFYNINDIRIRLVVAIHYLTMNDQFERNEKY